MLNMLNSDMFDAHFEEKPLNNIITKKKKTVVQTL